MDSFADGLKSFAKEDYKVILFYGILDYLLKYH